MCNVQLDKDKITPCTSLVNRWSIMDKIKAKNTHYSSGFLSQDLAVPIRLSWISDVCKYGQKTSQSTTCKNWVTGAAK